MEMITFCYLISMAVKERLDMRLMDIVTTYLYGKLDNDIYIRVPEGLKIPNMGVHRHVTCTRLSCKDHSID